MLTGRLSFTRVVSFACSGADSYNVRHTAEQVASGSEEAQGSRRHEADTNAQFDDLETQLDEYDDYLATFDAADDFAPDLVVLSIGGMTPGSPASA